MKIFSHPHEKNVENNGKLGLFIEKKYGIIS